MEAKYDGREGIGDREGWKRSQKMEGEEVTKWRENVTERGEEKTEKWGRSDKKWREDGPRNGGKM